LAEPTTVEVIDPTHPLYGRRFPIHSISRPLHGAGHVFVVYHDQVHLRVPLTATDLNPSPGPTCRTKLSCEALRQLLALLQQWDTPCRNDRPPSGSDFPPS